MTLAKKGGAGKTTLIILLAEALRQTGRPAQVMDYDAQGSATKALEFIGSEKPEKTFSTLIDSPPLLSTTFTDDACRRADVILIPTSPSPLDLLEVTETYNYAKSRAKTGAKIYAVINKIRKNTVLSRGIMETLENQKIPILEVQLSERQSFQKVTVEGWGALDKEAKDEALLFALAVANL